MDTLEVFYLKERDRADLTYSGSRKGWLVIARVCNEHSDSVEEAAGTRVSVPWGDFIRSRNALAFQSEIHGFTLRLDESAEGRLEDSASRLLDFEQLSQKVPKTNNEVRLALRNSGFGRPLKDTQLRNVARMARASSAANFSVPGSGKTAEALAYFTLAASDEERLLVVAPKSAFPAWEEELGLCFGDSVERFVRLVGGREAIARSLSLEPRLCLITYQQLANVKEVLKRSFMPTPFTMILDESHRIKKGAATGIWAQAVLEFATVADHRMVLSGTPMPNDVSDLIPQFRFLYPEYPVDASSVTQAVASVYVRTTRSELPLPNLQLDMISIPLKPAQRDMYQLLRSDAARLARGLRSRDQNRLRRLGRSALRMIQLVSNPSLLAATEIEHTEILAEVLLECDSPKLEYACRRARFLAAQNRKTLIWSSFVLNVELVANRLEDLGAVYIHGGVDAGSEEDEGTREAIVRRFHDDPRCWVLVANPAACGEGISLHHACRNAIYLDRNYNAAQFLQSQDRIHRIGLDDDDTTFIEVLVAPDTVDDSVRRRIDSKMRAMATVLQDPDIHPEPEVYDIDSEELTTEDIEDFITHISSRTDEAATGNDTD